jgi:hypothetical protein
MKIAPRIYLSLLCLLILHTKGYSQIAFEKNYRLRCDSVLAYFSSPNVPRNLFSMMAKYATGNADSIDAPYLHSLLQNPSGNMFWMYPVTGVYFYGRKYLLARLKADILESFSHYNADTGITENHKLMYYSSLFLISGEDEKDTLKWFNHKTSAENYRKSASLLKTWMNKVFNTGFAEFNSPHYAGFYLSPLLMLYDFSKDKEIKIHAEMLIWRILADYLTHYRFSAIEGVCSRVTEEDIFDKKNSESAQLIGFFTGDRPLSADYNTLFFALSSFTFPEILNDLWNDEQKYPYEETDAERSMDKINLPGDKDEGLTACFYADSSYSLGSIMAGHNDEIQTRTWSLDWKGRGNNNALFGLNPYISKTALSAYFPGNPDTVYKNILKQRPFYDDTNKWIGGSPYENLFQYKNVLLGIYNFPDTLKNNSVSFFIPNNIDTLIIESTVLYAKTDGIYFALRFSQEPEVSQVNDGKRYRIRGRFPAFALEVYSANKYKSLHDFHRAMDKEFVRLILREANYERTNGVRMDLYPNGEKLLNGEVYTSPPDMVYKSPFMNITDGIMTVTTSNETVVLDWNKEQIAYLKGK